MKYENTLKPVMPLAFFGVFKIYSTLPGIAGPKKIYTQEHCCLVSLEERWFWFTLGCWPDQLLLIRDTQGQEQSVLQAWVTGDVCRLAR